jgi:hypothetical protein
MPKKKNSGSAAWRDSNDAPALTEAFFDHAPANETEFLHILA